MTPYLSALSASPLTSSLVASLVSNERVNEDLEHIHCPFPSLAAPMCLRDVGR